MPDEKTFEEHLREIAEQSPGIGVATAVRYADTRMRGEAEPLPEPWDSRQIADWAGGQPVVTDLLTDTKYINAIIHFDIAGDGGGKWTLDTTKSEGWVSEGLNGASKMTVTVSNDDFVKITEKKLNAQMAAMQGKLKFKPMDMGLAMKLGTLLS